MSDNYNMELIYCNYCKSSLVNMIDIKVLNNNSDIAIKEDYVFMNTNCININLRCYSCGKNSVMIIQNKKGCVAMKKDKGEK